MKDLNGRKPPWRGESESALEKIVRLYDPAAAPEAEQLGNRRDNRRYARTILALLGKPEGKRILFLGMGQEEAAILLARRGARVEYVTWSEKALAFAGRAVLPDYPEVAAQVAFRLADPRAWQGPVRERDCIVIMKAAKQLSPPEFETLLRCLLGDGAATPDLILHTSPNALLMAPAFFLARLIGGRRRWKSLAYGLKGHSYFGWRRLLRGLGRPFRISVEKQPAFFSRQVIHQPGVSPLLQRAALWVDRVLDSPPAVRLSRCRPVRPFLGTDLWALVGEREP